MPEYTLLLDIYFGFIYITSIFVLANHMLLKSQVDTDFFFLMILSLMFLASRNAFHASWVPNLCHFSLVFWQFFEFFYILQ